MDFSPNDEIGQIKSRLLSPGAAVKRIALLDNVKTHRFSWAELEALITADEINVKQLYVGDGSWPNTLTWFITLNGASLSTDMAQRAIVVKIKDPKRTATWEEDTQRFMNDRHRQLIADLVGCFHAEQYKLTKYTRWASWERSVLSRLPEPAEAQQVIIERQGECDAEGEETEIIEDFFRQQLERFGYATDRDEVFIPSDVAIRWLNWATGEKHKVPQGSRLLTQRCVEGPLPRLKVNSAKTRGRGFVWEGEHVDIQSTVHVDLLQRIAMLK